jgi:DNA-directed RNA polymerase II subunit RPB2
MPFSKDGIVPDIIINPHGLPSRMSTGHLIEAITGKMCSLNGSHFDASPFENERELENITQMMEYFDYEKYGNEILTNGFTGEQMMSSIYMGVQYYQRMKHMVHDKFQSRDVGPKTILERQPVKGRSRQGGLRIGEMERDSLISHGLAGFMKESYTVRSDNYKFYVCKMCGRIAIVNPEKNIYKCNFCKNNYSFDEVRVPYCTKLFIQECEAQSITLRLLTEKY